MLKKLKKFIQLYGLARVTSDLGFRSVNTLRQWIDADKIPDRSLERVKNYLQGVTSASNQGQEK